MREGEPGKIEERESPIHHSNAMLYSTEQKIRSRIGYKYAAPACTSRWSLKIVLSGCMCMLAQPICCCGAKPGSIQHHLSALQNDQTVNRRTAAPAVESLGSLPGVTLSSGALLSADAHVPLLLLQGR